MQRSLHTTRLLPYDFRIFSRCVEKSTDNSAKLQLIANRLVCGGKKKMNETMINRFVLSVYQNQQSVKATALAFTRHDIGRQAGRQTFTATQAVMQMIKDLHPVTFSSSHTLSLPHFIDEISN